jgi:hypothetical protein
MQEIQKKYEQDVPLKCEMENHNVIEHQRNYQPLGVG